MELNHQEIIQTAVDRYEEMGGAGCGYTVGHALLHALVAHCMTDLDLAAQFDLMSLLYQELSKR
jgi:uncharacterized protein (DUF885 family)